MKKVALFVGVLVILAAWLRSVGFVRLGPGVPLQGVLEDSEEIVVGDCAFTPRAEGAGGFRCKTSMTRGDTGNGACEVVYVERFAVITPK